MRLNTTKWTEHYFMVSCVQTWNLSLCIWVYSFI